MCVPDVYHYSVKISPAWQIIARTDKQMRIPQSTASNTQTCRKTHFRSPCGTTDLNICSMKYDKLDFIHSFYDCRLYHYNIFPAQLFACSGIAWCRFPVTPKRSCAVIPLLALLLSGMAIKNGKVSRKVGAWGPQKAPSGGPGSNAPGEGSRGERPEAF